MKSSVSLQLLGSAPEASLRPAQGVPPSNCDDTLDFLGPALEQQAAPGDLHQTLCQWHGPAAADSDVSAAERHLLWLMHQLGACACIKMIASSLGLRGRTLQASGQECILWMGRIS